LPKAVPDETKSGLMRLVFGVLLAALILVPSKSLRAQIAGSGAIQGRIVDPTLAGITFPVGTPLSMPINCLSVHVDGVPEQVEGVVVGS
jgi:hypothetical protein